MTELKQGGKEKNPGEKPRLGDIVENRVKLNLQLKSATLRGSNKIDWTEVRYLVSLGADPNAIIGLYTPLLIHAVADGETETCRFLLDNGANANFQMKNNGQTALMFAACKRNGKANCEALVEHGADIFIRDNDGKNAIWYADKMRDRNKIKERENDALRYLTEVMIRKILAERYDAFMLEFNECIKG